MPPRDQRSGINRGFTWLRKVLQITEETEAPSVLSDIVRPSMDVFGWERLAGLVGTPPQTEANQGALAGDSVLLSAVPDDVMRYVIFFSCSHDDPATLALSLQIRTGGFDFGIDPPLLAAPVSPARIGLSRNILIQPGDILLCRSSPAPAAGTRLFIRYKFVDLDPGEYLPAL